MSFRLILEDLAPGDQRSRELNPAEFQVDRVRSTTDPLFKIAYSRLWQEFGHKHEIETEAVLAKRFAFDPAMRIDGVSMRYEMILARKDGVFAAARDHTAIVSPEAVVVHLSHLLVDESMRRSGLAGWMRALPLQTARDAMHAAGITAPISLAGEMELPDPAHPDRMIRLRAYEKAGFVKIDPAAVAYLQPDFRPPEQIDAGGGARPLAMSLIVGREAERTMPAREAKQIVRALYQMYARTFRPADMAPCLARLDALPDDAPTQRIHVRLPQQNHWTFLEPERRYQGETDPRKIPLIIGGGLKGNRIYIAGSRHLRLQDLVLRGSPLTTIDLSDSSDVTLEGVTLYAAGGSPFRVTTTRGLTIRNCAIRGVAAPWTFRAHMKYRGAEAKVVSTYDTEKNQDFDISHSEFTDACDGLFIGQVKNLDFHHNLVDNFSDDGFNLTAILDPEDDGAGDFGNIRIHENRLSRCLAMFVFGGRREGSTKAGSGVYVYRNIIDQRPPVFYHVPKDEAEAAEVMATRGWMTGDHGRGLWEPVRFYHNTVLLFRPESRGDYAGKVAGGASRSPEWKVLNNIFVQAEKPLGFYIFSRGDGSNLFVDGNLHWSLGDQSLDTKTFIERLHFDSARIARADGRGALPIEEISRWALHDQVADPKLTRFSGDWREPVDLRLTPESPAVNAGVEIPAEWPDPLRASDAGKPDIGAIPLGAPLPAPRASR